MPHMSVAPSRIETKMNFRLDVGQKRLIEQAASLTGQSLTSFAIAALTSSAQEIVERFGRASLSGRDGEIFLAILDSDDEPARALVVAVDAYRRKVG